MIYARFSPRPDAQDCDSVEKQRDRCRSYCKAHGYDVIAEKDDEDMSGGRADNRPGLQRAIALACKHKAVLVVYKLDRPARNTRDALDVLERLQKSKADLVPWQRSCCSIGGERRGVSPPVLERGERRADAAPLALPDWVAALLTCPLFGEQKRLAGRAVPADEVFGKLLAALDGAGGKMTATALARRVEMPLFRLRGLLAVVQRVLNVEGYAVLGRDEASDTVELNRDLLLRQFDLLAEDRP